MSSLAASRADNFYFPPEWRPEYGGLSKFAGSKGANQYEQHGIIRFELPFDGWCLGCNRHFSKGHRFNAKKYKAEKYYSTQIWAFDMTCPSSSCTEKFRIKTDPENQTYQYCSGIRKHEQEYTPDPEDFVVHTRDDATQGKLAFDPMNRLQEGLESTKQITSHAQRIASLEDYSYNLHKRDFDLNAQLRETNRAGKKRNAIWLESGKRRGLSMPLLPPCDDDYCVAKKVKFSGSSAPSCLDKEKDKMTKIKTESIFISNGGSTIFSASNSTMSIRSSKSRPCPIKASESSGARPSDKDSKSSSRCPSLDPSYEHQA